MTDEDKLLLIEAQLDGRLWLDEAGWNVWGPWSTLATREARFSYLCTDPDEILAVLKENFTEYFRLRQERNRFTPLRKFEYR